MVRVIKSPYLKTPQLLDVDRSKVRPLVSNLFRVKARQAPQAGRLKCLFRKQGKIVTKKKRCEYFVHCAGFHNSFLPDAISLWFSPISKGEPRGKVTNKFINKRNVEQRSSSTGEIRTWGISEQFVIIKLGGWRSSISIKSQISEPLHTLPTFENGSI